MKKNLGTAKDMAAAAQHKHLHEVPAPAGATTPPPQTLSVEVIRSIVAEEIAKGKSPGVLFVEQLHGTKDGREMVDAVLRGSGQKYLAKQMAGESFDKDSYFVKADAFLAAKPSRGEQYATIGTIIVGGGVMYKLGWLDPIIDLLDH
jgi:hypothetical protein